MPNDCKRRNLKLLLRFILVVADFPCGPLAQVRVLFRYNKSMKRGTKKKLVNWLVYFGAIIFWAGFWLMFFFLPPVNNWRIVGFLASLFFALGFTFYSLSKNLLWSGTAAFYLTGILFLELINQFHWLNIVLFSAVCLAVIYRQNKP